MSEAQKRAYIIADNKLALNAGWDTEMLAIESGDLAGLGFDLSLTGFGDDELASILNSGNPGLADPDDIPEVPKEPVTHTPAFRSAGQCTIRHCRKKERPCEAALLMSIWDLFWVLVVHSAHATAATRHRHRVLLLRSLSDHRLGGHQQASHRSRVL